MNLTSVSYRSTLLSVPAVATRVPSQARAVRTRALLLDAARREFSVRGYAATTSKSIADRAKVATGSFYQYFTSKDVVLRELAAARLATIATRSLALLEHEPGDLATSSRAEVIAIARTRLGAVVAMVTDLHREDPALHGVMTERRHADPELDALWTAGEHTLVQRIATLLERWHATPDPLALAFVLFGMVEGSVHAHVLGTPVVSDERFTAALVDALLRIIHPVLPQ
jgi:AcrR family transcriptional regulator